VRSWHTLHWDIHTHTHKQDALTATGRRDTCLGCGVQVASGNIAQRHTHIHRYSPASKPWLNRLQSKNSVVAGSSSTSPSTRHVWAAFDSGESLGRCKPTPTTLAGTHLKDRRQKGQQDTHNSSLNHNRQGRQPHALTSLNTQPKPALPPALWCVLLQGPNDNQGGCTESPRAARQL
jgi:hypothetical protein